MSWLMLTDMQFHGKIDSQIDALVVKSKHQESFVEKG